MLSPAPDFLPSPEAAAHESDRALPAPRVIENASALLKAVADPGRLSILVLLRSGALCVSDLAARLKMSESAVMYGRPRGQDQRWDAFSGSDASMYTACDGDFFSWPR